MRDRTHAKEIAIQKERCFLCAVVTPERNIPGEDPLDEMARLIDTAGGEETGRLYQRLDRAHPKTYFGKGKLGELAEAVRAAGADTLVVDDDLSPKQLSQLEEACERKVIDRNEVILDIFQANARSYQAKLQVELAQLQYELPRLVRKWTHLERLGGGIGTRGPGESQLETDRRLLRSKISLLRSELDKIEGRKKREVGKRETFSACLVGYTNAGKSSLMNRLTTAEAFVEDRLFATLDTLTRRIDFDSGANMLLSDTVGFIRRLPHHLVASFHATLEEAAMSDLLLHVVDASDPLAKVYIESVQDTLKTLGMAEKNHIYVLNKTDNILLGGQLEGLLNMFSPAFPVSAKTGEGISELFNFLQKQAEMGRQVVRLSFPAADGRRFAMINQMCRVIKTVYVDDDAVMDIEIAPFDLDYLKRLPGEMRVEVVGNAS